MTTNLQLDRIGGRRNFDLGMLLTLQDLNAVGDMHLQSLFHLLALFFYDAERGEPMSGFPEDSDFCRVTMEDELDYKVASGWGLVFEPDALGSDEWGVAAYRPVVVESEVTGSLDAHDPGSERIDVLSAAPQWVEDQFATRNFKNPMTGARFATGMPQRRRFGGQVVVTKGVPGDGAPATPAGHIKLAEIRVPAGSGAATVVDHRPILQLGQLLKGQPSGRYIRDFVVPDGADSLEVSQAAPAQLAARVKRGRAVIGGVMRAYPEQVLGVNPTGGPGLYRIDTVVARADGTLAVVEGEEGQLPRQEPDLGEGELALGSFSVDPGSTTIAVFDMRVWKPFDGGDLRDGTVGTDALAHESVTTERLAPEARAIYPAVTLQSYNSGTYTVDIQLRDVNGSQVHRELTLACQLRDPNTGLPFTVANVGHGGTLEETGDGTELSVSPAPQLAIRTSAQGRARLKIVRMQSIVGRTVPLEVYLLGAAGGNGYLALDWSLP